MGQYWKLVNLDKREFVNPHKVGTGLKLWEQLANSPGTGAAMVILQAAMPVPRGGGDFTLEDSNDKDYTEIAERTIGRWAGDRVVLIGDYAEDSDLPRRQKASKIYSLCISKENWRDDIKSFYHALKTENNQAVRDDLNKKITYYKSELWYNLYTDISDDVARVIEYELDGKYEGDGWREFKYKNR